MTGRRPRRAVAGAATPGAKVVRTCCVCDDSIPKSQPSKVCRANLHHVCKECLQGLVTMEAESSRLRDSAGEISCPHRDGPGIGIKCPAEPWRLNDLEDMLETKTLVAFGQSAASMVRAITERENKKRLTVTQKSASHVTERMREHRLRLIDEVLTLRCPRCHTAFVEYEGCDALVCMSCGCGFCSLCLLDCGRDAHSHIGQEHGTYYGGPARFDDWHADRRRRGVLAFLLALPEKLEVRLDVLESVRKDLKDLRVDAGDIRSRLLLTERALPGTGIGNLTFKMLTQIRLLLRWLTRQGLDIMLCAAVLAVGGYLLYHFYSLLVSWGTRAYNAIPGLWSDVRNCVQPQRILEYPKQSLLSVVDAFVWLLSPSTWSSGTTHIRNLTHRNWRAIAELLKWLRNPDTWSSANVRNGLYAARAWLDSLKVWSLKAWIARAVKVCMWVTGGCAWVIGEAKTMVFGTGSAGAGSSTGRIPLTRLQTWTCVVAVVIAVGLAAFFSWRRKVRNRLRNLHLNDHPWNQVRRGRRFVNNHPRHKFRGAFGYVDAYNAGRQGGGFFGGGGNNYFFGAGNNYDYNNPDGFLYRGDAYNLNRAQPYNVYW